MSTKILIDYIKENGLQSLANNLSIKIKYHGEFDNLVLLKYDQINSDMGSKIVQQCRGIILDASNDYNIVCRTFDKFFNDTEIHAAKINWDSAKIYNKLDGSLCQLYYYNDSWIIATSGTPDASGNVGDFGYTFKDLFWETWNNLGYNLPKDTGISYAFEMCTPFNTIVVQHEKSSITLIGARRLSDSQELNPVIEAHCNKWDCAQIFSFNDREEIVKFLEQMDGSNQEGFVVCDSSNYNRVKMKCADYVKKHRLVSSMNIRNMLDVIRTNEAKEVLLYCPQFKDLYCEIKAKYERFIGQVEGFYLATKHIEDRKQFAMAVKDQIFSGLLFGMKYGKIDSIEQGISKMHIKSLEHLLGIKSIK